MLRPRRRRPAGLFRGGLLQIAAGLGLPPGRRADAADHGEGGGPVRVGPMMLRNPWFCLSCVYRVKSPSGEYLFISNFLKPIQESKCCEDS